MLEQLAPKEKQLKKSKPSATEVSEQKQKEEIKAWREKIKTDSADNEVG